MTQSPEAKHAAIRTLLPLLWYHLDDAPMAMKIRRYGDVDQEPKPPQELTDYTDCTGRCYTCRAYLEQRGEKPNCPPEEKWLRDAAQLRRDYPLGQIEAALLRLADHDPLLAQCVHAEYVEPWPTPKSEPIAPEWKRRRHELAEQGVAWLAGQIPFDVREYGQKEPTVDERIAELLESGKTWRTISATLGVGNSRIATVSRTVKERRERTLSAGVERRATL